MADTISEEPRFDEEELKEIARLQSDPTSEHYYNDPDETFMSKVRRKLEPYGEEFKGFIEYLFSPSKHFGTSQYNEGGLETQMSTLGLDAEGRRRRTDSSGKYKQRVEEGQEDIAKAASFLVPFYDSGVNISNVLQEYMKPEQERDYEYIKSQFTEAGQSAALEAGLLLMGGVVGKYGSKGVKALADKIKQYEIDPSAMSAFGVGAIRKKDTFEEVMTPVKVTKKGTKKTGEAILRPSSDLAEDLDPRLKRAMAAETAGSIMPGPGKFFNPSKRGYKGDNFVGMLKDADIELDLEFGNYIMMGKGKPQDVSNETFENLFVSARPSQKNTTFGKNNKSVARANLYDGPSLSIADMKANYKAATGKTGVEVRTNLLQPERFKIVTDEGDRLLDHPIVAVETKGKDGKHFYTLDTQFVGPVRMDRLTQKAKRKNPRTGEVREEVPQPNLRPATVGDVKLGEQVGTIRVGKKDHPLYAYIEVDASKTAPKDMGSIPKFNQGGEVMNMQKQMSLFEYGGIADDGMKKDPVSGNDIPPGSLASEVRDDIPAMLSEGEYVVPADVLRYYGVNFFENLRNKAKTGLQSMEQNGRIGGEPLTPQQIQQNMSGAPQAGAPAPMPVQANQGVLTMPKEYTQQAQMLGGGGFNPADWATVGGSTFNQTQESVTTFKTFVNAETDERKVIEFVNGKVKNPADEQYTVPPYYELGSAALKKAQNQTTQTVRNNNEHDGRPPKEEEGQSGNSLISAFDDMDLSDPLGAAKAMMANATNLGGIESAGLAGVVAGPAGMGFMGLAQTGSALTNISNLNALSILAEAQGKTEDAKTIAKMADDLSGRSNLMTQALDDIVATGKQKGKQLIDKYGLRGTRDPKTGRFTFSQDDIKYNKSYLSTYTLAKEDETSAILQGGGATGDDDGGPTVTAGGGEKSRDPITGKATGPKGDKYTFDSEDMTTEEEAENDAIFDAIDAQFEAAGVSQNKGGLMARKKANKK